MSTPNPAEVIAEALAAHAFPTFNIERGCWDCPCGEPVPRSANGWEKHVASVIAALPDIAIVPLPSDPGDDDYLRWSHWTDETEEAFHEAMLVEVRRIYAVSADVARAARAAGGES